VCDVHSLDSESNCFIRWNVHAREYITYRLVPGLS
jgi:hypothetical protein